MTHTFASTCTPPPGQIKTTYYCAGAQSIAQRVITGSGLVKLYDYAGAQRVAIRDNGTLSFLLGDHLGSTSLVTCGCGSGCATVGAVSKHAAAAWFTHCG